MMHLKLVKDGEGSDLIIRKADVTMAVSVKDLSSWKRTGSYRLLVEPDPVR